MNLINTEAKSHQSWQPTFRQIVRYILLIPLVFLYKSIPLAHCYTGEEANELVLTALLQIFSFAVNWHLGSLWHHSHKGNLAKKPLFEVGFVYEHLSLTLCL